MKIRNLPNTSITSLLVVLCLGCLFDNAVAQTWTLTSAPTEAWAAVASSADGTRLIAAPGNGPIYLSTDSGATWSSNQTPVAAWAAVASSTNGGCLFAASAGRLFYVSTNSGATWSSTNSFSTNTWAHWASAACSSDGTKLVAASGYGPDGVAIVTSSDSAVTCRVLTHGSLTIFPIGAFERAGGVASSADGSNVVAGTANLFSGNLTGGDFFASSDSGVHWSQIPWNGSGSAAVGWSAIASSANGSNLVAVAMPPNFSGPPWFTEVLTSTNGGVSWISRVALEENWTAVASSADGERLVAVNSTANLSGIYTSTNAGDSWIPHDLPGGAINLSWTSVAGSADGSRLVAASGQGIYVSQPLPVMSLTSFGGNVVMGWPSTARSFGLRQSSDITTGWVAPQGSPILTNGWYQWSTSPTNAATFYRLASP
jgi:hypothetical protein